MASGRKRIVALSLTALLALEACGKEKNKGPQAPTTNAVDEGAVDEPQASDALPQTEEEMASLLESCRNAGKDAEVASIAGVVGLVNLLPKPVSVPCFLAALPRTYTLAAVESSASAQPASREKPRFLLALGNLFITTTGTGTGKNHIELSDFDGRRQSIKGELLFPIEGEIDETTPFAFKVEGQNSSCVACHGGEKGGPKASRDSTLSDALRPTSNAILSSDEVNTIETACATALDSHCQLVRSIFLDAEPARLVFPESMKVLNGKPLNLPQE